MNSKKYFVFEELLELSKKADAIVENAFADSCVSDNFFEDAKNKIAQIVKGNFKASSQYSENYQSSHLKLKQIEYSQDPFMKIRGHIRLKNQTTEIRKETSTSTNLSNSDITEKELVDSGVIVVSSSDAEENVSQFDQQTNDENLTIQISDSQDTSLMLDLAEHKAVITNQDNAFPFLKVNSKICLSEELSSETNEYIDVTPDAKISNNAVGKTYVCKKNDFTKLPPKRETNAVNHVAYLRDRRLTRSTKRYYSALGIFLDETFYISEKTSCKTDGAFNKTYVLDSKSSEETIDCKIKQSDINAECWYFASSETIAVEQGHNKYYDVSMKKEGSSTSTESSTAENEKNTHLSNVSFDPQKSKELWKSNNQGSSTGFFSEENAIFPKYKSSSFRWKLVTDNVNEIKTTHSNTNYTASKYFGAENAVDKKPPNFKNVKCINSATFDMKTFSDISPRNYVRFSEKDKIADDKSLSSEKEEHPVKTYETTNKICEKNICCKEYFRPKSGLTNEGDVMHRSTQPKMTLEDRINNNRKSLRDKASEKAKQRDFRIRKAKERRELLEQERKEKAQIKEQKLKGRFQRHEIILKQKRRMFQRQMHQYGKSKPSHPSTSSSGGKDSSKDNDDFCRDTIHISQESSRGNNYYHDESIEKVSTASLEGNVGLDPKTSTKHKSILKNNKKTPVELLVSSDITQSRNKNTAAIQNNLQKKDLEDFKDIEQQETLCQQLTNFPVLAKEHKTDNKVCKKPQKHDKAYEDKTEISQSKIVNRIKSVSNKLFSKQTPKIQERSYFLRSTSKIYPNKMSDKPLENTGPNINQVAKNSHEIILSSSDDSVNKFCHSCFNSAKKDQPKKFWKSPSSCKALGKKTSTAQIINKKRCATYSTKKNYKTKKIKKTSSSKRQDSMSYKISDTHENSFDESEIDLSKIPFWASGVYLKEALIQQYYASRKTEEIFGPTATEPVSLTDIFQVDKPLYHVRTSSEKWYTKPLLDSPI